MAKKKSGLLQERVGPAPESTATQSLSERVCADRDECGGQCGLHSAAATAEREREEDARRAGEVAIAKHLKAPGQCLCGMPASGSYLHREGCPWKRRSYLVSGDGRSRRYHGFTSAGTAEKAASAPLVVAAWWDGEHELWALDDAKALTQLRLYYEVEHHAARVTFVSMTPTGIN